MSFLVAFPLPQWVSERVSTGWAKKHRTPRQYASHTQFKFTQHALQCKMAGWQQCPRMCTRDLMQPQNLIVFSVWLTQAVTLSRSAWWPVCGCMRDSTGGKSCAKWWLRFGSGLIRLHHEERNCWIGKNERSLCFPYRARCVYLVNQTTNWCTIYFHLFAPTCFG
jgi:hypothetical protein